MWKIFGWFKHQISFSGKSSCNPDGKPLAYIIFGARSFGSKFSAIHNLKKIENIPRSL